METVLGSKEDSEKEYQEHELESAVDTLLRAEKIKEDSKMMSAIQPLLKSKKSALAKLDKVDSLDKLKKRSSERIKELSMEED